MNRSKINICTNCFAKLKYLNTLKIELFTDVCFNNLPNDGSQAGQIIFITDSKNHTWSMYWTHQK